MRKTFKDFYEPSNDEALGQLWDTAYFSFDTSVLHELFDVSKDARDEWLNFVGTIPVNRRWLTFQVAREYHSGVERIIQRHLGKEQQARSIISSAKMPDFEALIENKVFFSADAKEVFDAHLAPLRKAFSDWKTGVFKTIDALRAQYEIDCEDTKNRIAKLFDGQVGPQYSEQWLREHHAIAAVRRDNKIPPGYAESKNGNSNGDVFIWFELLAETKKRGIPLVFVTKDQQKDDWFLKDHANIVRCPRPELLNEMRERAGQDVVICTLKKFLDFARKRGAMNQSSLEEFAAVDAEIERRKNRWKEMLAEQAALDQQLLQLEDRIQRYEGIAVPSPADRDAYLFRLQKRSDLHQRKDEITEEQLKFFREEVGIPSTS